MSTIIKCTRGEVKALVEAKVNGRTERFSTEFTPLEITPSEGLTPARGTYEVVIYTTNYNPSGPGRTMRTNPIWLPIQRIEPDVNTTSFSTPRTQWRVQDALGKWSSLLSTQAFRGRWDWGFPVRYSLRRQLTGSPPLKIYGLKVEDAARKSKVWTSSTNPIHWEAWCGCRPNEKQCGSFPRDYCCLYCSQFNRRIRGIESTLRRSIRQIDSLINQVEATKNR